MARFTAAVCRLIENGDASHMAPYSLYSATMYTITLQSGFRPLWVTGLQVLFHAVSRRDVSRRDRLLSLLLVLKGLSHWSDLPVRFCAPSGSYGGGDLHGLYSASSKGRKLVCWYPSSGVRAVIWQSGWGYILPGLPCPRVSSDRATVSPYPRCLSLQYLCCNSLCVGGFSYLVSYVNLL